MDISTLTDKNTIFPQNAGMRLLFYAAPCPGKNGELSSILNSFLCPHVQRGMKISLYSMRRN